MFLHLFADIILGKNLKKKSPFLKVQILLQHLTFLPIPWNDKQLKENGVQTAQMHAPAQMDLDKNQGKNQVKSLIISHALKCSMSF